MAIVGVPSRFSVLKIEDDEETNVKKVPVNPNKMTKKTSKKGNQKNKEDKSKSQRSRRGKSTSQKDKSDIVRWINLKLFRVNGTCLII